MILSQKFRVYPNRVQERALADMLADFCGLYNAALQQRIEAWRRCGASLSYYNQALELKSCRALAFGLERWAFSAEQQVLRRLDKAFRAFFRRLKRKESPGFPRFRSAQRFHSADLRIGEGLTIRKSGRIRVLGVPGEIKVKWHRKLLGEAKATATLTRENAKWYIVFMVEVETAEQREGTAVGVDCGLSSLAALSNGELFHRPNVTKRDAKGLRRRQRALARCKRGSKRRAKARVRLAKYSAKTASRRRDYLHKVSADIVSRFGDIAVEDLHIKGLARTILAKDVHDAAWAQLISMLDYKAAKAGSTLIKVDPRGTSQTCPECGTIKPKRLSERRHRCDCGADLDRDVAAAMVVHFRAFGFWPGTGLQSLSRAVA